MKHRVVDSPVGPLTLVVDAAKEIRREMEAD